MIRIAADDLADFELGNAQMMADEIPVDFAPALARLRGQIMKDRRTPWMI